MHANTLAELWKSWQTDFLMPKQTNMFERLEKSLREVLVLFSLTGRTMNNKKHIKQPLKATTEKKDWKYFWRYFRRIALCFAVWLNVCLIRVLHLRRGEHGDVWQGRPSLWPEVSAAVRGRLDVDRKTAAEACFSLWVSTGFLCETSDLWLLLKQGRQVSVPPMGFS